MQKSTSDELWRIGRVRSPGFNTQIETPIPCVSPLPTPVSGCTTIETRRPFSGSGKLASRSTSASIACFLITTGSGNLSGPSLSPVRSMNLNVARCISFPLSNSQYRRDFLRMRDPPTYASLHSFSVKLNPQRQIRDAHAQRLEQSYVLTRISPQPC